MKSDRSDGSLAVLLMARIEKRLGTTLPLAALFSAPTLEALAALAETSGGHPAGRLARELTAQLVRNDDDGSTLSGIPSVGHR